MMGFNPSESIPSTSSPWKGGTVWSFSKPTLCLLHLQHPLHHSAPLKSNEIHPLKKIILIQLFCPWYLFPHDDLSISWSSFNLSQIQNNHITIYFYSLSKYNMNLKIKSLHIKKTTVWRQQSLICLSGRVDSNHRSLVPQTSTLTWLSYAPLLIPNILLLGNFHISKYNFRNLDSQNQEYKINIFFVFCRFYWIESLIKKSIDLIIKVKDL